MAVFSMAGSNPALPTYPLQRSVRLRSSASAYFNRTPAVAGNRRTWTWSGWVKRGTLGATQMFFQAGNTAGSAIGDLVTCMITSGDVLRIDIPTVSLTTTTAVYRDPSAWYHIVISTDTTQATASNRMRVYVNGLQQTFSGGTITQNADLAVNNTVAHYQGRYDGSIFYFDGYLEEVNFIDGQALTPSSFGAYNSYGVWSPAKYTGTYGTNGFYLNFQDNSALTTTANIGIGKDSSGNGNYWTSNNISLTAGATYDSMLDVPTLTSNTNANYATLNAVDKGTTVTVQNANLQATIAATHNGVRGTFQIPTTGKWYWEVTIGSTTTNSIIASFGVATAAASLNTYDYNTTGTYSIYCQGSPALVYVTNGVYGTTFGSAVSAGTVCNVAYDADNGQLYLGIGNTYYSSAGAGTGNPSTATNPSMAAASSLGLFPYVHVYSETVDINFGQRPFTYTPPTGFNRLNTYNLPDSIVPVGAQYMAATLYTGNSSTQTITNTVNGVSMQPDFVWTKGRSQIRNNTLYDSVRGATKQLYSNSTNAELTVVASLTSFNSNGFSLGGDSESNWSSSTYVGWQWRASNASAVTNTAGTITSSVSANQTAGFSIVTYTGNGVSTATIGHGLGVTPAMVILKSRSLVSNWWVNHKGVPNSYLQLDTTGAALTGGGTNGAINYQSTNTSTTFSFLAGSSTVNNVNQNAATYVAYCFAAVPGYSAFGSYTGNGSADGPFVYTGFRPRWILIKNASAGTGTDNWIIKDSSRNTFNVTDANLYSNLSNAEDTISTVYMDFLSNGFKIRGTYTGLNGSGNTIIYAAFAENPFKNALAR